MLEVLLQIARLLVKLYRKWKRRKIFMLDF